MRPRKRRLLLLKGSRERSVHRQRNHGKRHDARAAGQMSLQGTFAFTPDAPVLGDGSSQDERMQAENLRLMLF